MDNAPNRNAVSDAEFKKKVFEAIAEATAPKQNVVSHASFPKRLLEALTIVKLPDDGCGGFAVL